MTVRMTGSWVLFTELIGLFGINKHIQCLFQYIHCIALNFSVWNLVLIGAEIGYPLIKLEKVTCADKNVLSI